MKQEFGGTCDWIKKRLGEKVASVQVSNRLRASPCVLAAGKFGWSANMERCITTRCMSILLICICRPASLISLCEPFSLSMNSLQADEGTKCWWCILLWIYERQESSWNQSRTSDHQKLKCTFDCYITKYNPKNLCVPHLTLMSANTAGCLQD